MPTVQQLIDKIDYLYPNSFTDAQKVDVMNDVQREIFRELQKEDFYEFTTIADQCFYTMPSNMSIEHIIYVGISSDTTITDDSDFQEYTYAKQDETLTGYKYFDGLDGQIGIYPVPDTTGENARIRYYKRPGLMSTNSLTATPDLEEDWQKILVYGAISELASAGSSPDIDVANNFTIKYNSLMQLISQARYERAPHYPSTKDVMKKTGYVRRRTPESVVIIDVD